MIKTSLLRYAAIGMATVSMAGFAAASTVTLDTTGADSTQKVAVDNTTAVSSNNVNSVGVGNGNAQVSASGDVDAYKNTESTGDVKSGDASNGNTTETMVEVGNTGVGSGLAGFSGLFTPASDEAKVMNTGADSTNKVEINNTKSVEMNNVNDFQVSNTNIQASQSGNVSATKSTSVGGLSSGDAQNTSHTTTTIKVGN